MSSVVVGVAVAVVATAVAVPLVAPDGPGGGGAAGQPTEVPRDLAVAPEEMDATLAALLPSAEITDNDTRFELGLQQGQVRWHGVTITVQVDARNAGTATPAWERCVDYADGPYCEEAAGDVWTFAGGTIGFDSRTGAEGPYGAYLRAYVPGGYRLEVTAEELRGPVDRDLLSRIALDDVWWR